MSAVNHYHRTVLSWLSRLGVQYMEEYPVEPHYLLDIYLPELRRGVELDGPYHNKRRDARRDEEISQQGIEVVRIKVGTPKQEALEVMLGSNTG